MRTKYDDVIRAWLDGAEVEEKHPLCTDGVWKRFDGVFGVHDENWQYRIKPEKQVLRYRVAKLGGEENAALYTVYNDDYARRTEQLDTFIDWLHDWQEVEVE